MPKIAIIGAGSWGTALGKVLAEKGLDVILLARRKEIVDSINSLKENPFYLPGIPLPGALKATLDPEEALSKSNLVIWTIPSHTLRENLYNLEPYVSKIRFHLSGIKGIDIETTKSPLQLLREHLGEDKLYFVLGGPSFALEVAKGLPTAVVVAGPERKETQKIQELLAWKYFRVYRSYDPLGVEIASALKNVIAIASGICDGLGLGLNARAGLITRGLIEIIKLGTKLGGKKETFYGLAGLGDLVLTCTGALSRNYQVGLKLGEGKSLEEVLKEIKQVAEGVKTVSVVKELSEKFEVSLPICEEIYNIIYKEEKPRNSIERLLARSLKEEFEEVENERA
ncbi:glycerol-3-phosphate dehydrogenase [Caldimicrobium thiodismutans]|jgi:glycerol-3-phosphate dehydrogenase (NAD(P)+)|uniref:Glycerol-3-phosphate dehydrogenase [NAD(P)+] n=1 Tax=Caldimicrobium thiodismutans TaxID=1653476 RepID=A0A0U5AIM7_9BACT|nr:NAD(P)H-dependent glycerol-3-phosphate dehydrogenase [Caldimicrobium thiodismutans]BAU23735.1 glycerol-3-phosphate dehydrogenase [Caldimicrobium thiodismutans]